MLQSFFTLQVSVKKIIILLINSFAIPDTDMTLSMMFCNEVQPPTLCTDNETALEVTGLSTLPQEVDVFRCACADSRPLVIDEMYLDSAHFRHMKYVCPNFKVCIFFFLRHFSFNLHAPALPLVDA